MAFCSLDVNDILQGGGVILVISLCIGWIARRLFLSKKGRGECCSEEKKYQNEEGGCNDCPLSKNCRKH